MNQAINYSLFEEAKAADGAFHNNKSERYSLQEHIRLQPLHIGNLVRNKPKHGLFTTNDTFNLKPEPMKYNLTHPKFNDGTPIPIVPMTMGNIKSKADLNRVDSVSVGQDTIWFHEFQDTMYVRDNKLHQ
jgi:hypothetical protein